MKRAVLSVLFAVASAAACAGIQAADAEMAASLPQPCTVLICGVSAAILVFRMGRTSN